jgi:hypothetical protein
MSKLNSNSKSFDTYITEFREGRESVINIMKIVLEQKKVTYLYIHT